MGHVGMTIDKIRENKDEPMRGRSYVLAAF
jgi:hypothetical protein